MKASMIIYSQPLKWYLNPFFISGSSFLLGLVAFSFKWSESYSDISTSLLFVLLGFILMFFLFAVLSRKIIRVRLRYLGKRNIGFAFIFFLSVLLADFFYTGQIGIINLLFGEGVFYKDIKHLPNGIYVLGLSVGATIQILSFCYYLVCKDKFYFAISFATFVLLSTSGTRAILVLTFISCLLFKLQMMKNLNLKLLFKVGATLFLAILLFSIVGNLRSDNYKNQRYMEKHGVNVENILVHRGKATQDFVESNIPKSFFWIYTYMASPISNLDSVVNEGNEDYTTAEFIVNSFLPDAARSATGLKREKDKSTFKLDIFNSHTIYGYPAAAYGYLGVFIANLIILVLMLFVMGLCYYIQNSAVILMLTSSSALFMMFANMFQNDVYFLSIVIICVLTMFSQVKLKSNGLNKSINQRE